MDKWDAQETLQLIHDKKITHSHMVATMFHRMLHLPEEVRAQYDTSSLRWVVHGAAPTPVHVKQAIIDWWGPVLWGVLRGHRRGELLHRLARTG